MSEQDKQEQPQQPPQQEAKPVPVTRGTPARPPTDPQDQAASLN